MNENVSLILCLYYCLPSIDNYFAPDNANKGLWCLLENCGEKCILARHFYRNSKDTGPVSATIAAREGGGRKSPSRLSRAFQPVVVATYCIFEGHFLSHFRSSAPCPPLVIPYLRLAESDEREI